MPKVIDCMVFSEELEVLEVRLQELSSVVDHFVLVEANKTQSRLDKSFVFEEHKHEERFKPFLDKIVHVKLDEHKEGPPGDWSMEHFQRRSIIKGLNELDGSLQPYDKILISDVDEIPRKEVLARAVEDNKNMVSFNQMFGSYFFDYYCASRGWFGTVMVNAEELNRNDIQTLRENKDHMEHIDGGGWHFSSVGGFEKLWAKWQTRIEPHDKEFLKGQKARFEQLYVNHIIEGKHFLFCDNPANKTLKLQQLDHHFLPEFVRNNENKFARYLYSHICDNCRGIGGVFWDEGPMIGCMVCEGKGYKNEE